MAPHHKCKHTHPYQQHSSYSHSDSYSGSGSESGSESGSAKPSRPVWVFSGMAETQRRLSARHLEMIAIGGAVGTGLFIGSGSALAAAGPGGALFAYALVGVFVYFVVASLGEMAAYIPVSGSFNEYAARFIDKSLGFTLGWNYWFSGAITLPAEMAASAIIMRYWLPHFPSTVWAVVILVLTTAINVLGVRFFGEIEFWLSLAKVLAVVVFIVVGIATVARKNLGFATWTYGEAPFVNGMAGIFTCFVVAFLSYGGTEIIGITAGEAENPSKRYLQSKPASQRPSEAPSGESSSSTRAQSLSWGCCSGTTCPSWQSGATTKPRPSLSALLWLTFQAVPPQSTRPSSLRFSRPPTQACTLPRARSWLSPQRATHPQSSNAPTTECPSTQWSPPLCLVWSLSLLSSWAPTRLCSLTGCSTLPASQSQSPGLSLALCICGSTPLTAGSERPLWLRAGFLTICRTWPGSTPTAT